MMERGRARLRGSGISLDPGVRLDDAFIDVSS